MRHIPNLITLFRGLCGPAVAWLLIVPGANHVAFWLFLAAIVSDLLDGWAARKLDAHSAVGLWLDPLMDKMLTDTTWTALAYVDFAPVWLTVVILARNVAVIGAWAWAFSTGHRWEVSATGQTMVAFEGTALCVFLYHGPWLDVHWPTVGTLLGCITLALSLGSLLGYALRGPVQR